MCALANFKIDKKNLEKETLKVIHAKKSISANLRIIKFVDKDTNQTVVFLPTLDISGYGETLQNALDLLNFSVSEYFKYLVNLSPKNCDIELLSLGWKREKFSSKNFSKLYVDRDGELKDFNAIPNTVEHLSLQSA